MKWQAIALAGAAAVTGVSGCGGTPAKSAPATWSMHRPDIALLSASTKAFDAYVTRVGCSGGFTGKVRAPQIKTTKSTVVVTFKVAPIKKATYTCPGNALVRYKVELPEPLGNRSLIDGECADPTVSRYVYCRSHTVPGARFSPAAIVLKSNKNGKLIQAGEASAIVASSAPKFSRGVGISGYLTLTDGHCIGLTPRRTTQIPHGGPAIKPNVIVWPPGTKLRSVGDQVFVTSEGKTVRVGDKIQGGSSLSYDLAALRPLVPAVCRLSRLQQVGLGS